MKSFLDQNEKSGRNTYNPISVSQERAFFDSIRSLEKAQGYRISYNQIRQFPSYTSDIGNKSSPQEPSLSVVKLI